MKTVTREEAIQSFGLLGEQAHAGETIVVTDEGRPWIQLLPASELAPATKAGKSAAAFQARLEQISAEPIPGVPDILSKLRRSNPTPTHLTLSPFTFRTTTPPPPCVTGPQPAPNRFGFTPLHRLELRTTVRQCVFTRLIRESDGRAVLSHIEEDLHDGTLGCD